MARGEPGPPNRWTPVIAFGGIVLFVGLALLIAFKPVSTDSPIGSGNCGDGAFNIVVIGKGASEIKSVHGNTKHVPSECYRAAERDLVISAGTLLLPFVVVFLFARTAREGGGEDLLEPQQDYYQRQRRRRSS